MLHDYFQPPYIYCKLHCHSTVNPEKRKRKSPFLLKCRLLENKTAKRIHYTSCDILNPFKFFFFSKIMVENGKGARESEIVCV